MGVVGLLSSPPEGTALFMLPPALPTLSPTLLPLPLQEGADLFMLPAIDMINHSTDPALRTTSLQKVGKCVQSVECVRHKVWELRMHTGSLVP